MMWGMGLVGLLILIVLALAAAALIKYLHPLTLYPLERVSRRETRIRSARRTT